MESQFFNVPAIIEDSKVAFIVEEKCIGCGECIAVCKTGAVRFKWSVTSEGLQKKMVEHAFGVYKEKKDTTAYITFLTNMTKDCDCMKTKEKMIPDIGIMASYDPVALDLATMDLTKERNRESLPQMAFPDLDPMLQINHALKLGMGTTSYRLIEI